MFYNRHKHDVEKMKSFNFNHIVDGIYIGNNMCCRVGLNDVLKSEGITVDITLEEKNIDNAIGADVFIWVPVVDGLTPKEEELRFLARSLKEFVANGRKVYVHCQKGHGRSASTVMAYLLLAKRMSFDDAFMLIKEQRDDIHLNSTQVANLKKLI